MEIDWNVEKLALLIELWFSTVIITLISLLAIVNYVFELDVFGVFVDVTGDASALVRFH